MHNLVTTFEQDRAIAWYRMPPFGEEFIGVTDLNTVPSPSSSI